MWVEEGRGKVGGGERQRRGEEESAVRAVVEEWSYSRRSA